MKILVKLFVFCLCLSPLICNAATINIVMDFAYNGADELNTQGFKLYQTAPDGTEVVAVTIPDPDVRSYQGPIDVVPGRSMYALTAYSADRESPKSVAYPFEYIEPATPGMPAPTVIIRFN